MTTAALSFFLPVVGFFVLGAAFIVLTVNRNRRTRERTNELQELANRRGWRYRLDGRGLEARFRGEPFGRGHANKATQVVEGTYQGWPFIAFDYSYDLGGNPDNRDTVHRFAVMSMHLGVSVPRLQIRPQSAIGRFFADSFGTDYRIGQQDFDDAFHLAVASPEFAQAVLTPEMRELLLATRGRVVRFEGDTLLLFREGKHTTAEIEAVLELMRQLLQAVPTSVWERLHGDAGPVDR